MGRQHRDDIETLALRDLDFSAIPSRRRLRSGRGIERGGRAPARGAHLIRRLVDRHPKQWIFWFSLLVYLATGNYDVQSIDVRAAEEPAWALATQHTWDLSGVTHRDLPWYFAHEGSVYSDRFPGSIAYLVPAYWIAGAFGLTTFAIAPGVVTAAFVAAVSVTLMHHVFSRVLHHAHALAATVFFAFGTGTWSVAANAPWSHTIDQFFIAGALCALAARRTMVAAAFAALVVPARPVLAVASLALGIVLAGYRRSIPLLLGFAAIVLCGACALVAYNGLLLDTWSISNGRELGGEIHIRVAEFPSNTLGAVFSLERGAIFYYPALVIVPFAARIAWRRAYDWEKAAAIAGITGLLTQLALNRYTGGGAFFGPRLLIEPLTLCAPLLARAISMSYDRHRAATALLLFAGVVVHLLGALLM